jgi:hypothetical protein
LNKQQLDKIATEEKEIASLKKQNVDVTNQMKALSEVEIPTLKRKLDTEVLQHKTALAT